VRPVLATPQQFGAHRVAPDAAAETVMDLVEFDRELRNLVFEVLVGSDIQFRS
jgi:hypothetical protein